LKDSTGRKRKKEEHKNSLFKIFECEAFLEHSIGIN